MRGKSRFKNQKSLNAVRQQLSDHSRKSDAVVQPVHTGQKIKGQFKPKEHKPPIVKQQNLVYREDICLQTSFLLFKYPKR